MVDFLDNINAGRISVDDMLKLKWLKDAWEFVLRDVNTPLTTDYIIGEYRNRGVGITDTNWSPKLPSKCNYDEELKKWIYDNCIDGV